MGMTRGAVMPTAVPPSECQRENASGGFRPDQVGRSPVHRRQPDLWRVFMDPSNGRQDKLPCKQCQALAWKVSRGVANGLAVSRTKAFKAIHLLLVRGRQRLHEYHKTEPWINVLVEAVEQMADTDWDLRDEDYDGYDGQPREGEVSEALADAGIRHCGVYDLPERFRSECVPKSVIGQIRNWKEETSKYPVHPLTELCKKSCKAPLQDGLFHEPSSVQEKNFYAFVKPKSSQKCAFIVGMRNLIEECLLKPKRSPLPPVTDVFETIEKIRRVGPVFGTTIDLTNFYWSLHMPQEVWDLFRLDGAEFHSLPFRWNFSPVIAQETLGDLLRQCMSRFSSHDIVFFQYLDDILLLARDRGNPRIVTQGPCALLRGKSLLMSSKSQTEPSATVTWIGKTFNMAQGTVRNTPGTIRKALAVVVRAAVSGLNGVKRVTGRLQWLFGPRRGMIAFMFGWYKWKPAGCRFAHRPSRKMILSMMDVYLIGLVPVTDGLSPPPPPNCPG